MRAYRNVFLLGLGIGAGLMFFYDPSRGATRRAQVRDKAGRLKRQASDVAHLTARDLRQRMQGVSARVRGLGNGVEISDDVLVERVRAELGRCVSYPRAIAVFAENGHVRLSGTVLRGDVQALTRRVRRIHGVHGVESALEVHEVADVPVLQGGHAVSRTWMPRSSPTNRALLGTAGFGLWTYGWLRGGLRGFATAAVGALCLGRAMVGWTSARGPGAYRPPSRLSSGPREFDEPSVSA